MSPVKSFRTPVFAVGCLMVLAVGVALGSPQDAAPRFEKANPAPQAEKSKTPDNSTAGSVMEKRECKIVYENDGTGTFDLTGRIRIQSQAGVHDWGVLNFPYASGTTTLQVFYVRVVKPDGRIVQTPPENILDMPAEITRQAPFYSDLKDDQVAIKGLEVGDAVEYSLREQITKPLDPGQFWLSYDFLQQGVILNDDLEISVPRNRQVQYKSPDVQPLITEKDARRIYRWHADHLQSTSSKDSSAAVDDEKPVSVRITSFRSWDEVGDWFRGLVASRTTVTPEIQAKADELTRGAKTDTEKIEAIYNFVSTKFRYISISLGIGRYQPHAAADVLTNDYGDCKDKHTLFAALLAAEHIKAYPALINSAAKIDPDLPSPDQFDHVITAIPQDKGFLFLDTTPEVAPFGFLIADLRDKKALVVADASPVRLVATPADAPFKSFFTFDAMGTLDNNGTLDTKMQISLRGDQELPFRLAFRQSGESQWKDVMQAISGNLGYGGTVSDVTVSSPDKTDAPFQVNYSYNRKNFGDWPNRQVPVALPLLGIPAIPEAPVTKPVKLGSPSDFLLKSAVTLPANSHPALPNPIELHEDFADYLSNCSFRSGVLNCERHLITKKREIPPGSAEAYRNFQKAVVEDYGTMIPLGLAAAESESTNPEAQEFYRRGREALQRGNVTLAREQLQKATEKDPDFARAWTDLALAEEEGGDTEHAREHIKKALALDPSQTLGFKLSIFQLMTKHKDQEALSAWGALEKLHPDDRDIATNMATILIREKRYTEAAAKLEPVIENDPSNSWLRAQLGDAYLRSGEKEKAIREFDAALSGRRDSATLNSVAYSLAEMNIRLDDALEYAEESVKDIEKSTSMINLQQLNQQDLRLPLELAADWDTLGWVYFHLGHFDLAESYISAAWKITQDPVIADHLGQIYEKLGKTHVAAVAYARALSATEGVPEETNARLKALRPGGKYLPGERPDPQGLQDLRSKTFPKFSSAHGSAEFFVLLDSDAKFTRALFISGSESFRDENKVVEQLKFDVSFPKGSSATILRRGILDCEAEAPNCMFVFFPPDSVHSLH
jgi:Flp pilus assembly protein TadD